MLKRDRLWAFLVEHPGTHKMSDIFKLVDDGFSEPVSKHTIRKVVKVLAIKNGSKRWATWTIIPDGVPYYPGEETPMISTGVIDAARGMCCPACECVVG